ncbi:hypothetical protein HYR69_00490 [Candidatus Sumerlaeota bacterium]|nr:hypothetical protein [Candidatus Sumerlaeota bacterium]
MAKGLQEFQLGKPMLFGLVMMNVSDSMKWYSSDGFINSCFTICNSEGQKVFCKKGLFQTTGGEEPIHATEAIALIDQGDITREYAIARPGKYKIQFDEVFGFPNSNMVEFEVKDGPVSALDLFFPVLSDLVRPHDGSVYANFDSPDDLFVRVEHAGGKVDRLHFFWSWGLKGDCSIIQLWLVKPPNQVYAQKHSPPLANIEYLGENDRVQVFVRYDKNEDKVRQIWPSLASDVAKELKLKKQTHSRAASHR